jgi:hypothetical protein
LSKIVTVVVDGVVRTAELVGLLNVTLNVSFPFSKRLSSMMGMEMILVNSPAAKLSVPLVAV